MELKKEVFLLSAKKINFKDDTGNLVSGCQVYFYDADYKHETDFVGCHVAKAWLDLSKFETLSKLGEFPILVNAVYEFDLVKGKAKCKDILLMK